MKKIYFSSTLIVFFLITAYLIFFIYTFANLEKKITSKFDSLENLQFYKKYSNRIHHLRYLKNNKKIQYTEYLYSTIKNFDDDKKNILFQGDAWAEEINTPDDNNYEARSFIEKISEKHNLGFVNAGINSFSPTLMKLQLEILIKDFGIKPNILIAYIDQTDIGDENCRYKNKKIFQNNNLVAVRENKYSGKNFDLSKIFGESEIILKNRDSRIITTYKISNFKIKYTFLKFKNKNIDKYKRIVKFGYKNRKLKKCHMSEIQNYLINGSIDEIDYFKKTLIDYTNYIKNNTDVEKIFLVTFPHKNHLPNLYESEKIYKNNVSKIVNDLYKNNKDIIHLNFTKLIIENDVKITTNDYIKNDPLAHLTPQYYRNTFIKFLMNYIINNLNNNNSN